MKRPTTEFDVFCNELLAVCIPWRIRRIAKYAQEARYQFQEGAHRASRGIAGNFAVQRDHGFHPSARRIDIRNSVGVRERAAAGCFIHIDGVLAFIVGSHRADDFC